MNFRLLFPTFLFDADAGAGTGSVPPAGTEAGTSANPPADPPADPGANTDPPADPESGKPAPTQADIDKAYSKLREAEAERDRLKAEAKKRAEAGMTELEKAKARAAELEKSVAEADAKIRRAHLLAGLSNPNSGIAPDAVDLVASAIEVEYDDDGQPVNLDSAVAAFLEVRPSLRARAAGGTTSPGNPDAGRRKGEMTRAEVAELAKSDPTRFNELWDSGEIPRSALSANT